ncbi:MAG TPA: tol-pal system protein YbgF [Vicinamibacteria bacterium]|nr:tol-pal system protein YbgF [Vicinamibacteria bacterium]
MRRLSILCLAGAPWLLGSSAAAASKEYERLAIQMATLQGQVTEMQRGIEEAGRELQRLNQALADQNALLKKAVDDARLQDESLRTGLREVTERIGEIAERLEASRLASGSAGLPPASSLPPTAAPGTPAASGFPAAAPVSSAPPPRELYSQAYADYARGNYDLAIQEYREYLKNYPTTEFSDNAQFWIGECYYSKQKYAEAIGAWDDLFRDFPSSDKLPDARLKKGMALDKVGRKREALLEYRLVADRYPNSEAGRKARERLNAQ